MYLIASKGMKKVFKQPKIISLSSRRSQFFHLRGAISHGIRSVQNSARVIADFLVPLLSVSTLHTPNYAQKLYKPYTKPYIHLIINAFLCV